MKVRIAGIILSLLFLLCGYALPQDGKPNFSGSWTLDREKSDLGNFGGEAQRPSERKGGNPSERGGSRMGGPGMGRTPMSLVIEHEEPRIVIKRKMIVEGEERVQELNYTTDGKSNTNEGFRGMQVESKTHWEKDRLVTKSSMETPRGPMEITEVRSLSDNGATLTVEVTTKGGPREGTRKLVYKKEPL
jgi:hypothetical protein